MSSLCVKHPVLSSAICTLFLGLSRRYVFLPPALSCWEEVAAAEVVWGSDLLRFVSDAAEELGPGLETDGAGVCRCPDADAADPDVGPSRASLQDAGGGAVQSLWAEGLDDICEAVGEATCSGLCLVWECDR